MASFAFAQTSKFNIAVDAFPNYTNNFGERAHYSNLARAKLSLSYGVSFIYNIKPKVALELGVKHVNKGQRRNDLNQLRNFGYLVDGALFFTDNIEKAIYNYNYLSTPVMVKFAFGNSTDKGWFIRAGLAPTLYLSSNIHFQHVDDEGISTEFTTVIDNNIRDTHLNLVYGLGYSFLFKEKLQFSIEPEFEFFLYKTFHEKTFREIYHSLGINFRVMVL